MRASGPPSVLQDDLLHGLASEMQLGIEYIIGMQRAQIHSALQVIIAIL
jgi:hypothetical protein